MMTATAWEEIQAHRRQEGIIDRENRRLGRVQNALLLAHPGDLRLCPFLPPGRWAVLPADWHILPEIELTLIDGIPPKDLKGPIVVSVHTAQIILDMAK